MEESTLSSVMVRTRSDVSLLSSVTETLRAQQQLLQKLYADLDEERECSATAASEAMDMILRLQGEKAAVEMEANHYKRIAEEKIGHAEATLEAFEELFYHKEMEIESLEFQVQTYKNKLVSLECDLNANELEYVHNGLNDQSSNVRRLHSMAPFPFKKITKDAQKRERSPSPLPVSGNVINKVVLESTNKVDLTKKSVDFACGNGALESYWNKIKIKMLEEKMRMISDCNVGEKSTSLSSKRVGSSSIFSLASTNITCDKTDRLGLDSTNSNELNEGESTQDRVAVVDHRPCTLNFYDVFEVPKVRGKHEFSDNGRKRVDKWNSEVENRSIKPVTVSEGIVESCVEHDADKQKGMNGVHREIKASSLKDLVTIIGQKKERIGLEFNSQTEFQKLHQRIARLERERISTSHEITCEGDGEEQLRLLKDIQSQVKLLQSDIKSWKTIKATPMDDNVSLGSLKEAMLHFWL